MNLKTKLIKLENKYSFTKNTDTITHKEIYGVHLPSILRGYKDISITKIIVYCYYTHTKLSNTFSEKKRAFELGD